MADWESFLPTQYAAGNPEMRKRAQELAYAMMAPKEGRGSRSWGQPIADILQVIAGQHMIKKTTEAEAAQRGAAADSEMGVYDKLLKEGGYSSNPTRRYSVRSQFNEGGGYSSNPTLNKGVTTGSIPPFKTEVNPNETDLPPGDEPTPEDYEKAAREGGIKPGGFGEKIPPFKTTVERPDPANFDMRAYLKRLSGPESSEGKFTKVNRYGYGGPFALRAGENGLTKETYGDNEAHIKAASEKTKENIAYFQKRFGIFPSEEELHLMHNQGATGAAEHLLANPNTPAWQVLKQATPIISVDLAKRRIKEQIGSGAALAKKPVEEITTGEFRQYMNDKFNGGWRTRTNAIAGQGQPTGRMNLGGPKPEGEEDTPNMQETPIAGPTQGMDRRALRGFLENPMTSPAAKDKVREELFKGGTPEKIEHPAGHIEFNRNDPSKQYFVPKQESSEIHTSSGTTVKMKRQGIGPNEWGPWKLDVPAKKKGPSENDLPTVDNPAAADKLGSGTLFRFKDPKSPNGYSIGTVP